MKQKKYTKQKCEGYDGEKYNGFTVEEGKPLVPLKTYKEMILQHLDHTGMINVFEFPDPLNSSVKWNVMQRLARSATRFPLSTVERRSPFREFDLFDDHRRITVASPLMHWVFELFALRLDPKSKQRDAGVRFIA